MIEMGHVPCHGILGPLNICEGHEAEPPEPIDFMALDDLGNKHVGPSGKCILGSFKDDRPYKIAGIDIVVESMSPQPRSHHLPLPLWHLREVHHRCSILHMLPSKNQFQNT